MSRRSARYARLVLYCLTRRYLPAREYPSSRSRIYHLFGIQKAFRSHSVCYLVRLNPFLVQKQSSHTRFLRTLRQILLSVLTVTLSYRKTPLLLLSQPPKVLYKNSATCGYAFFSSLSTISISS